MEDHIWEYQNTYQWMSRLRKGSFPPMMVCVAITGGVQGKEANPNLPETPEEQAEQTYECYKAGASLVHVHVRDPQAWYNGIADSKQYRLANGMIRDKCPEIIINNTTGGSWGMPAQERVRVLDANPELATLNMGPDCYKMTLKERRPPLPSPREAVLIQGVTPIDYAEIELFASEMKKRGIKPEMELYQPGHYWTAFDVIEQGLVDKPYLFQFVMGYQTSPYATILNALSFVNDTPKDSIFFIAGIGPFQLPMTVLAIILGGHVRVGMEDNVYLKRGQLLKSNAEMVERIVRIATDLNRQIATPKQARQMLGISLKPRTF